MALIPIFKPYTIKNLDEQFHLEVNSPEWVSIEFQILDVKKLDHWLDNELSDTNILEIGKISSYNKYYN